MLNYLCGDQWVDVSSSFGFGVFCWACYSCETSVVGSLVSHVFCKSVVVVFEKLYHEVVFSLQYYKPQKTLCQWTVIVPIGIYDHTSPSSFDFHLPPAAPPSYKQVLFRPPSKPHDKDIHFRFGCVFVVAPVRSTLW